MSPYMYVVFLAVHDCIGTVCIIESALIKFFWMIVGGIFLCSKSCENAVTELSDLVPGPFSSIVEFTCTSKRNSLNF